MPLWKLQPLDLSDPNWEASSHRGLVIVRASDEDEARDVAQRAFGVKTRFSPGEGVKAPPWVRACRGAGPGRTIRRGWPDGNP